MIKNEGLLETPNLGSLIATGGAATATRGILAARDNTVLEEYSPMISLLQIRELKAVLISLPLSERIKINNLPANRADFLPAALITIEQIMLLMGHQQLIHSQYNLRYGIALDILKQSNILKFFNNLIEIFRYRSPKVHPSLLLGCRNLSSVECNITRGISTECKECSLYP